jgi:N-acetylglucosaminyldiphosphoundecaprenol N-acetyl-beta-D-mannosaminyltransferase
MERCYGPDVFRDVMIRSASKPIRHYFCGGKPGVAEALKTAVQEKFANYNVVGTMCPPFAPVEAMDCETIGKDIAEQEADIVWIGLSTPKQEYFAARLAKHTTTHCLVTVGAAFDFHTGKVRQAPSILQKAGLEWLFRLCVEPGRLWRRYARIVPLFVFYNVIDFFAWGKE